MTRVLIADDEPGNVKLLKLCLESEGYDVVTAVDGQQALEFATEHSPDVILLDVMMPVLDGFETCKRLKQDESLRAIPVIMVTALDEDRDIVRGFDAGADDYIAKPCNDRVVRARTRTAVRRSEAALEVTRLMNDLEQRATTDALTGLMNRRTFFEGFERELQLANRHDTPLSVVMLDVDFFKKINDDYGHPAGDATLRAIAAQLKSIFRATDLVCRFGGEEFAALLPVTNELNARETAERSRVAIAGSEILAGDAHLRVTASFGVASRSDVSCSADHMLAQADEALTLAKRTGRNRVVLGSELTGQPPSADAAAYTADAALCGVCARDVMSAPISCVHEQAGLDEAVQLLLEYKINSVPVTNDDGLLVGIISEKDVMLALGGGDLCKLLVKDQMATNVMSFQETDSAQSIFRFLCRNAIRRVVVVDGGQPTGVISRGGLLRWIMARSIACHL